MSSAVSSFAPSIVQCHDTVQQVEHDSARLSNSSCDEADVSLKQHDSPLPSTAGGDQPMDLTTPSLPVSTSPVLDNEKLDNDVVRRQKQKASVDAVLFNHTGNTPSPSQLETSPIPPFGNTKHHQFSDTEDLVCPEPQHNSSIRTGSKRKSEHPIKVDHQHQFEPSMNKIARQDPVLVDGGALDARQFIRFATTSLREHLSTTTNRLVEDVMSQIEAYFCVQSAPPGCKMSKACQTDIPPPANSFLTQQQQQLLASTYAELLAAAGSNGNQANPLLANSSAGHTRNAPSPPSLLSSMAQFGGISTLYSPVSPPQQQAALAALAANNRANSQMNASLAGLLPSPVPGALASGNPYQYNPYLANVFQSAAQALIQQQQNKQQSSAAAAAALLNNLNASNAKKFSAASLAGQTSSSATAINQSQQQQRQQTASPSPSYVGSSNNHQSSSTSALDFSSVANFMAAAASKRKRTKVTDTRLSARTARKLLDNSFQGGMAVSDEIVNVDGTSPVKLSHERNSDDRNNDDEALALVKGDAEDFENDERILLGDEMMGDDELGGGDDGDMSPTNGAASSASSRVSVGAGGDQDDDMMMGDNSSSRNVGGSSLMMPFTPSRHHQLNPSFQAAAALHQNGLAQLANSTFALGGKTSTLTSMHLRKAKLMFFYVRYPSSSVLKIYFPDVSFNKNNTAQLVKWFSNFREFYYINIEKFARQLIAEGVTNVEEVDITRNCELFKVLNLHYNRNNQLQVPPGFDVAVRTTVREFMRSILLQKDQDPSWKKQIYKVIARLDEALPAHFRDVSWMNQLLAD